MAPARVVAAHRASLLHSFARQPPQEQALEPSPELLAMLVCPVCRTPVKPNSDRQGLRCPICQLIYPIRDGFPVMIKEEARQDAAGASPDACDFYNQFEATGWPHA